MVLAWHVDYWDYLGWKDPFGAKAFTERQKRYRKMRTLKFFGTPQLFVANQHTAVRQLGPTVAREAARKPTVKIKATAALKKGKIAVAVKLDSVDPKAKWPPEVGVVCVLFQKKAKTNCGAGENAGKTLMEHFVVRQILAPLSFADALRNGVKGELRAPKGVKPANLGVAVLVEDQAKMVTLECVTVPVKP